MSRISVAMAVYNGEKYIREQMESILLQLSVDDEVVVSYNESNDNTWNILLSMQKEDDRIKLLKCEKRGVISNFENAIINCSGEIIFLADQDDVWHEEKIVTVLKEFRDSEVGLVQHDALFVNAKLESLNKSLFNYRGHTASIVKNIFKNCYQGCCMAFRAEMINYFMPFPKNIPMHDQWIGIVISKYCKVSFINRKLIMYRIHENNASPKGLPIIDRIINRVNILYQYKKRTIINR